MTLFLIGLGSGILLGAVGYKVVPVLVNKLKGLTEKI